MPLVVLALLLLWAVVEIAAFVLVAELTGIGTAFVLLVVVTVGGGALARRVARRSATRLQRRAGAADAPPRDAVLAQAAALGTAAVLLITPGFVGSLVGVLLLLPPVRALAGRGLATFAARRLQSMARLAARGPFGTGGPFGGPGGRFGGGARPFGGGGPGAAPPSDPFGAGPFGSTPPRGGRRPGDVEGTASESGPAPSAEDRGLPGADDERMG